MRVNLGIPIIFEVVIFGPKDHRRVPVILDTGARFTVISWDVLKEIGYNPTKVNKNISVITANGVIRAPFLKVKAISIGDIKLNDIEVVAQDIPELADVEGLLGLSFLEKTITLIDFKNKFLDIQKF